MHQRRVTTAGSAAHTKNVTTRSHSSAFTVDGGDRRNTTYNQSSASSSSSSSPLSYSTSSSAGVAGAIPGAGRPSRTSIGLDGTMTTINEIGVGVAASPPKQRRRRIRRTTAKSMLSMDVVTCLLIVLVLIVSVLILGGIFVVILLLFNGGNDGNDGISGTSDGGSSWWSVFKGRRSSSYSKGGKGGGSGGGQPFQFDELPPSRIYTIPHSMSHIGDRSDEYARLRQTFDALLPFEHNGPQRSLLAQDKLRTYPHLSTFTEDLPYDVYNCPDVPPPNYPHEWSTLEVLRHWNADDTSVPSKIHQGLCVFDFRKDFVKALTYRNAELPFVVHGDPEVAAVVERWNTPTYLDQLLGNNVEHRAEISMTNHFMYWVPPLQPPRTEHSPGRKPRRANAPGMTFPDDWTAPTKMIRMTYPEFRKRANVTENIPHDSMHWYFRLIGCGETGPKGDCDAGSSEWLFDELTFFQPRPNLLYLVEPSEQRGIHCRFGMQGVTIANHYDNSRNAIVVLGGERRYILSHPKHCPNMALYPRGHPSARHSAVDWSDPDLGAFPDFAKAESNEIVLQAGDVLYLPTNWFHYIVSMGFNFQCNTRSGTDRASMEYIHHCG